MGVRKPKSSSQLDHILYSTADFLWSGCLVAPLVVTYWRGTWDLLEDWVGLSMDTDLVKDVDSQYIFFKERESNYRSVLLIG